MGLIRRTFKNLTPEIFRPLYLSLVRSRLEYGQSVWSPHYHGDINRIEQVQRRATKRVNGLGSLSYPARLKLLNLPTLIYRRRRGDMIETFKILNGHLDKEASIKLERATDSRRGNDFKLIKKRFNRDNRKYMFTNRIVNMWNSLPNVVVTANSVNSFKNALDRHWKDDPIKYDPNGEY